MAEPVVEETLDTYLSFTSEFDSITIPPPSFDNFSNSSSDQALLGNSSSDMRFMIDGDGDRDFQLNLDSVEDHYFPSENESFFIPAEATNLEMSSDYTSASGSSGDSVNKDVDKNADGVLSTSRYCNRESPRDSDCSGTAQSLSLSTKESANCVSDILGVTNASTSLLLEKMVVDPKLKVEEEPTTTSITKRKKVTEEDTIDESRNNKYRRLDQYVVASGGEEDNEKRNVRLIRNRESAQLSRQRKKQYMEELEDKVKNMKSTITELNSKMSYFMAENATLRQQVGPGSGMCWPRHPPYPMAYPWMPYPAYMVKPQGSQVPLLPIPRLKPQQSVAKVKMTRKVASVSVLGLLLCLFLFCVLAPIVNISYGEYKSNYVTYRVYDQSRGRVLDVNSNRAHCGRDSDQVVGRNVSATENLVPPRNSSEPLVASLFVSRNEKLVKIDGNLIIHSVLANEKARSSVATTTKGIISPALPLFDSTRTGDMSEHLYSESETQKALSSSGSCDTLKDQLKSTKANGKMQQWFREGVSGPAFSSGMCTKVFQFDVSSTLGAIIPASPPPQQSKNTTDIHKGKKNRRILRGGLPVSDFNLTKDHNSSSKESFRDTKPAPSMVVSVLVDPREGSDGDINEMMGGTKSLSRVFIVVFVDGAKYVTYSCVLPRPEVPHLVTT